MTRRTPMPRYTAVFYAGLVAGALDLLYAFVAYGLIGVTPVVILQSIASGRLGRAAYQGGFGAAAIGALSHFAICVAAAAIYLELGQRLRGLATRPLIAGPVFGAAMFGVMNYVVVPLSAAVVRLPAGAFLWVGLLVHMLCVGLPIAWIVTRSSRGAAPNIAPSAV